MAFAAHFGFSPPTSGGLQAQQLMLTTKTSGSQSSPGVVDGGRGLIPAEGRGILPGEGLPVGAALPYLSRMAGLPESVYAQAAMNTPGAGIEPSAFYALNGAAQGLSVDRSHELWKNLHHQSPVLYPFDPMLATHPYGAFYGGFDLNNAARRKNATRETTSALKAWLYEHRKNPYPTKGEKIMLAIITKMTLTQVSTWFANARRRLKKESKVGWSKDKDIDDNDDSDVDVDDRGTADESDDEGKDRRTANVSGSRHIRDVDEDEDIQVTNSDLSDISDTDDDRCTRSKPDITPMSQSKQLLLNFNRAAETSPLFVPHRYLTAQSVPRMSHPVSSNINNQLNPKPKIWSIADFVNTSSKSTDTGDNRTVQICDTLSQRRSTSASNDDKNIIARSESSHTERLIAHAHKTTEAESAQGKALNLSLGEKEKTHEAQSTSQHTDSGSSDR